MNWLKNVFIYLFSIFGKDIILKYLKEFLAFSFLVFEKTYLQNICFKIQTGLQLFVFEEISWLASLQNITNNK